MIEVIKYSTFIKLQYIEDLIINYSRELIIV